MPHWSVLDATELELDEFWPAPAEAFSLVGGLKKAYMGPPWGSIIP